MRILGIETSCDDTAAAAVENGRKVLSAVVNSQVGIFAGYGGVIPEVAARSHLEAILPVVDEAMAKAGCGWGEIDAVAVTYAPGLLGSLLIGTLTARTMAVLHEKPFYPVHHLKSHIYANWLGEGETPEFPLVALVVSGGHTQILYMTAHNEFEIIGTTQDDAVGECFDKVAKIIGLPYPGGPAIAEAAAKGDTGALMLPHPQVDGLDFSFSGLKTAVLREAQKMAGGDFRMPSYEVAGKLSEQQICDIAASFQKTAVEILAEKVKLAVWGREVKSVVVAGGVSANLALREAMMRSFEGRKVYFPEVKYSGDNGAMVAAAAYYESISGVAPADPYHLDIYPRVEINYSQR